MPPGPDDSEARRAFVVVIDALGAGAEPDAADYGDDGAHTLRHLADAVGGLRPARRWSAWGSATWVPSAACRAARAPGAPRRSCTTWARARTRRRATGSSWASCSTEPLPTYPGRAAAGAPGPAGGGHRPAPVRRGGARRPRRARAPRPHHLRDRRADRLHVGGLGRPARGARGRRLAGGARGRLRGGPDRAARPRRGRPRHRAAVPRRAGRVRAHARPPRLRAAAADPLVPRRAARRGGAGARRREGRRPVRRPAGSTTPTPARRTPRRSATLDLLVDELPAGLAFANLIETDQVFGHRKDVEGFHAALREIDAAIAGWLDRAAGRGTCWSSPPTTAWTPRMAHADHTRERVPLLARFAGDGGRRHDGPMADVGASVLHWLTGSEDPLLPGDPVHLTVCSDRARAPRGRDDPPQPGAAGQRARDHGARRAPTSAGVPRSPPTRSPTPSSAARSRRSRGAGSGSSSTSRARSS